MIFRLPFIVLAALCATVFAARAENLDRIAVTVGSYVITESDLLTDLRVAAFLDGQPPDFSADSRRKSADRLVEQYLVLQDAVASYAVLPSQFDVPPLLAPVKARYASDAAFGAALERAGITVAQLTAHLLAGLRMLRYTDVRFRPEVRISEDELHDYFNTLAAKEKEKNLTATLDFEASREKIETLLIEERVLQALDRWLGMTRTETQILYREEAFK